MKVRPLLSGISRCLRLAHVMSLSLVFCLIVSCSGGDAPQESPSGSPPAAEIQSPAEIALADVAEETTEDAASSTPPPQAEDSPQIETSVTSVPTEPSESAVKVSPDGNVPSDENVEPSEAVGPDETLVRGVAIFQGDRPRRTIIKMDADPTCQKIHAGKKVGSEGEIVSSTGRIANVFVYVKEGLSGYILAGPSLTAELDQRGCVYRPHVQGIMVGQTLNIRNSDTTLHNINCQAANNPGFNFGQPTPGVRERVFRKPEPAIKFKCDVHPWMNAWLFVMDHPYFAVTERDGSFAIPDLPPGDYTLAAWHEKFGEIENPVSIAEGQATTADFTFVP